MTPNLRRRSSKVFIGWWSAVVILTAAILASCPIGSAQARVFAGPLLFASHLFLPFIVLTWVKLGLLWGMGLTAFASLLVPVAALSSRQFFLLWLPCGFIGVGWLIHTLLTRWQGASQANRACQERLEQDLNTGYDEVKHLEEIRESFRDRLSRYQQLRQIANSFSTTLALDGLTHLIVEMTGQIIQQSALVLLYLVGPRLTLELKSVWRRQGTVTVKAKAGDPFDFWVMRQAQPLLVQEPAHDFRFPRVSVEEAGRILGSLLAVPLASEHRAIGVLRVESVHPRELGPEELRLVRIIGDLASLAIENARLYHRMEELSITDDLTGLNLRRYFQKRLDEELLRADETKAPVSLLLIDIDRFKEYNDTFGHSAGDKLLKQIAGLLMEMRKFGEVAARLGGEEFACLLPGIDLTKAGKRAELIRNQVESIQIRLRRALTQTTVSIGAAAFPKDGQTGVALLQKADERLYQAKAKGRNQVCIA